MNEEIFEISSGEYKAQFTSMGAALVSLQHSDKDLVERRTHSKYFSGEILAPWPNRIRDGRYAFQNSTYQLHINEISRGNALHGLVFNKSWKKLSHSKNEISFTTEIEESNFYPGSLELKAKYLLAEHGLISQLTATNIGKRTAPYGASVHPYFVVPGLQRANDFFLKIGADQVLMTDEARLLPLELVGVGQSEFDFRKSRQINNLLIDHAFRQDPALPKEIWITNKHGHGVVVTFSENLKWIQVHTADRDGGIDSRKALAVEPMTCPPDAFNSNIDLVELKPGDSHAISWKVQTR